MDSHHAHSSSTSFKEFSELGSGGTTDSGFLSGSCMTESEIDLECTSSSTNPSYQRLDSGVDLALSTSALSLDDSKLTSSSISHHSTLQGTDEEAANWKEYAPWENYFIPDEDGDTQLHIAIMTFNPSAVTQLISLIPHPSILDFQNDASVTPLHLSILTAQAPVTRILLAGGASLDMRDRGGNTALHLACRNGYVDGVSALTTPLAGKEIEESGVRYRGTGQGIPQDLELLNYDGLNALHLATLNGHVEVIQKLHWLGANINAPESKGGRTALHLAVERQDLKAIKLLVSNCSANKESINYSELTPYQIAVGMSEEFGNYLINLGALPKNRENKDDGTDNSDCDSDLEEE